MKEEEGKETAEFGVFSSKRSLIKIQRIFVAIFQTSIQIPLLYPFFPIWARAKPGKDGVCILLYNFIYLGNLEARSAVAKYCSTPDYTVDSEVSTENLNIKVCYFHTLSQITVDHHKVPS